jgi:hypothetical protein
MVTTMTTEILTVLFGDVSIAYCASKTVVFEFVDSILNVQQIYLAPLSQGRGQGEGSVCSRVIARKSPHLHPLPFPEKGRGEIATQSFRG